TDLMSSWNNDYMKNVRTQMLEGKKPPSCIKCYNEEDAGHMSKRFWETEYWSRRVDMEQLIDETSEDGEIPPKIRYLDLRLCSKCITWCVWYTFSEFFYITFNSIFFIRHLMPPIILYTYLFYPILRSFNISDTATPCPLT
ncbi:hypothetical protein N8344_01100, partial [bacterium]|nr:hypothetical protein [bacterium]